MRAKHFALCVVAFVLSFILSPDASAANPYDMGSPTLVELYVNPSTGNDNNNGLSSSAALKTLRAAWNLIPAQTSSTGYRINLMPGSINATVQGDYLDDKYGTFQAPIILRALNGPGTFTYQGNLQMYNVKYTYLQDFTISNAGDAFHCEKCDHFLMRKMTVTGGNRQAHETVKVNQSQYFYIEDSNISQSYENPIDFVAVQYGHIINNKIHDGDDWCMYLKGGSANFTIENNELYNCGTGGFTAGQGTGFEYMANPWLHYEAYDIKFVNNLIHDTWGAGFGVNGGYNILLAHNTLYRVGNRSHGIEVVYGSRSCDGDTDLAGACQRNFNAGGWGPPTTSSAAVNIPNKNVYIYNNILYNPSGFQSQWSHFSIPGPATNSTGGYVPRTVHADDNLQIRGNILWNGPASLDLGIGEACGANNPTCNEAQLRADNDINTLLPQFVNPAGGDFHPAASGNILSTPGFSIPDFAGGDRPTPPLAPMGDLLNDVLLDRDGNSRNSSIIPGAYGAGGPSVPTAELSLSVADSPDPVVTGNTVTYTVSLANAGPANADNLIVSGNLTGATVSSASSSLANCAINANGYTCSFGSFAPGSASISVVGLTSGAGTLDFTASATSSTLDSNTANNTGSQRTTVSGDSDGDGVLDANDNCPSVTNANQADNDGDRSGDACDSDDDNDGIADASDNCPLASNANQADLDGDRIGDVCDADLDGDGRANASDNCPRASNADQADSDGDGVGNLCDNCPAVSNANQADANANGVGDACEVSSRDLIAVSWVTQPKQSCTGSGTSLSCTVSGTLAVKNQASTTLSTAFSMRYYLSSDGALDSADFLMRDKSSGTFKANQTKNIAFSRTLPKGQSGAGKIVIGVVDATNLVAESNEGNNRLASSAIGGAPVPTSYSASGRVADSGGAALSGVSLSFSLVSGTGSVPAAATSDSSGNWTASGFVSGNVYRATPSKTGNTFSPVSLDFSAASSALNFTAAAVPPPATSGGIIPSIDAAMKTRLQGILNAGTRNRAAFSKIGDSITGSGSFLVDIGCGSYDLGSYSALDPTLQYFMTSTFSMNTPAWCGGRANSFDKASLSADSGWTTNSALATGTCGESNFRCELRETNAAFAYIMYGTNDLERYNDTAMFQSNLSRIVSETISLGVVPILSTIPPRLDSADMNSRVGPYNQVIRQVAATYQIPVVDYWQALQNLGSANNYGISADGVHPTVYNNDLATFFTTDGLKNGYNVRNLGFLQMMEKMKRIVIENGGPDSNP